MNTAYVEIVLGKQLSKEDLETINYNRKLEFHSDTDIKPALDNDDWEKPYILVRNEQRILVAFGRLHVIKVKFMNEEYEILGIATVLSIEKKKGYGRLVIEKMKEHIKEKRFTAIGFCDPDDTPFYVKCGLGVVEKGTDRFIFPGGPKNTKPGDVIYIDGADRLVEKMVKKPREKVTASRPEW